MDWKMKPGAGDKAQWINHLPKKQEKLSLNPQEPTKPDKVTHTCNPNAPTVRWERETGGLLESHGPACLLSP